MNKILLIGNSGILHNGTDGQTVKVRLYLKKMKDEGFDVEFIDLENFIKRILFVLHKIKKGIKKCDRIVLISASRGCKYLIPYINHINKKYKKTFVLPLIGTSVLHHSIDKLNEEEKIDFLINGNYSLCKFDSKTSKQLKRITYILPETEHLSKVFKEFYKIDNVYTLNNFREMVVLKANNEKADDKIKLVFLSRVMKIKGIFDLLEVLKEINKNNNNFYLDIYGQTFFTNEETLTFNSLINNNIRYLGPIDNGLVCETISKYDLFVFPTRYLGEGTPGVIVESLIGGVPILTSSFSQAKNLLDNGKDSIFFEMFNKNDLKQKLLYISENKQILKKLKHNASASGAKYTYNHERSKFLKFVCGKERNYEN